MRRGGGRMRASVRSSMFEGLMSTKLKLVLDASRFQRFTRCHRGNSA